MAATPMVMPLAAAAPIAPSLPSTPENGGARHWAIVASAKLNGVEPLAWLTEVLERMVSGRTKTHELARLLPWNWQAERPAAAVDA